MKEPRIKFILGYCGCAGRRVCASLLLGLSFSVPLAGLCPCFPYESAKACESAALGGSRSHCFLSLPPLISPLLLVFLFRAKCNPWQGTRQGCVSFFFFLPSCDVANKKKFSPLLFFLLIRRATLCSWTSMRQDFAWQTRHGAHLHLLSCAHTDRGKRAISMQGICCRFFSPSFPSFIFCIKHNCEQDHFFGPHGLFSFPLRLAIIE